MNVKTLENAAVRAHARGVRWNDFWESHADAIKAAVPYDRGKFQRLVNRLLCLLLSGDSDGMTAVGDDDRMPWEVDDAAPVIAVSDTQTHARWQGLPHAAPPCSCPTPSAQPEETAAR